MIRSGFSDQNQIQNIVDPLRKWLAIPDYHWVRTFLVAPERDP